MLKICVAYFDPKSESRNERAQRLETGKENGSVTNGSDSANSHNNPSGSGVNGANNPKVKVVQEQ